MSLAQTDRIDKILVQQKMAPSRTLAQKWIAAAAVSVELHGQNQTVRKATEKFPVDVHINIDKSRLPQYVSRAGEKLAHAFSLYPAALACLPSSAVLDIGQSTGGFTDYVLQHGASKVLGIEVGHDQLDASLQKDARVACWEGCNARALDHQACLAFQPGGFDMVVMDVSFISQTLILPKLAAVARPGAWLFSLVKPQFEVGSAGLGKGGIVRDTKLFKEVEAKVCCVAEQHGWQRLAYIDSQPKGTDGNQEFFLISQREPC